MKNVIILSLILLSGCSAVRNMKGNAAKFVRGERVANLKVTAQLDKRASLENYRLINFYFRNLDENWIRVKSIEVVSLQGDQNFNVILGSDLLTWIKSMQLDERLRKENKEYKKLSPFENYSVEDHLYNKFSMPSMLQTQKWVLLQVSSTKGHRLELKITFINGETQHIKVDLV